MNQPEDLNKQIKYLSKVITKKRKLFHIKKYYIKSLIALLDPLLLFMCDFDPNSFFSTFDSPILLMLRIWSFGLMSVKFSIINRKELLFEAHRTSG